MNKHAKLAAFPYLLWMAVFIIVPLALIVVFAFTTTVTADADGNILTAEEITEVQDAFWEEYGEDADIESSESDGEPEWDDEYWPEKYKEDKYWYSEPQEDK